MHRFAQRPCQANSNHFTHSLLEQIAKLLEPIKKDLAHTTTALEALAAGVQDIREHMATKDGIDIAVEAAKIELKADIFASIAPMTRKVISYERRIAGLEKEKGLPNPDKH